MSGRYEITDRGERIDIKSPDGRLDYLDPSTDGRVYLDDIICGAIRQQARDIAELEVFAEIGRRWNADSSLAKWFPLTAERVEQDAQEIAKLRADLAAAVAERDRLQASIDDDFSGWRAVEQRWRIRAEQAEARRDAAHERLTSDRVTFGPVIHSDGNGESSDA